MDGPQLRGLIGPQRLTVETGHDIEGMTGHARHLAGRRAALRLQAHRPHVLDGRGGDVHAVDVVAGLPGLDAEPAERTTDVQDTGRGRLMGDFFTSEENKQLQKRRGAAFLDLVPPRFVPSFKPCLIRTPD